jgi:tetratricopeptide (TPR) repeat protein
VNYLAIHAVHNGDRFCGGFVSMNQSVIQECASLEDVALVRVLTVEKEQYDTPYLNVALREMENRGLVLADVINDVHMARNDDEGEDVTIAQALEQVDVDGSLWSLLTVGNCIGDAWVIQKEYSRWLVHFYEGEGYRFSFFYETPAQFKDILKLFLSLEPWEVEDSHELNNWKPIFQTRSPAFLTKVVADLDREGVLHTVKTPLFTHDKKGEYILTVPRYHVKDGERLVAHAQEELAKLYGQAEHLAQGDDREQELKVYDLLIQLVPDNPAVHYNRGQMLIEMGHEDDAVVALGEAIVLGLPEIPDQIRLNAKRGGGSRMAGSLNPLMSLVVLAHQSNRPKDTPIEYPDYIDDCVLLLERILDQRPDSIATRHCLATIAELKGDVVVAKKYYGEILKIDADDEAAKANLAYHEAGEG